VTHFRAIPCLLMLSKLYDEDQRTAVIRDVSTTVVAPLLFSYVCWILQKCQAAGISTLYFCSREGQILKRIADVILCKFKLPVTTVYLFVSRQSLHLAAIDRIDTPALKWLLNPYAPVTLQSILTRAGFANSDIQRLAEKYFTNIDPTVVLSKNLKRSAVNVLRGEPLSDMVLNGAAAQRQLALLYFRRIGLVEAPSFGLVDIGWLATLQQSLARILMHVDPEAPKKINGFYFGLRGRPNEAQIGRVHAFCGEGSLAQSWFRASAVNEAVIEAFTAADHGSVRRYACDESGDAVAELLQAENVEAIVWGLAIHQQSILKYVHEQLDEFTRQNQSPIDRVGSIAPRALGELKRFVTRPSQIEAEIYGQFPHPWDSTRHDRFIDLAPPLDRMDLISLLLTGKARFPIGWLHGSLRRSPSTPIVGWLLKTGHVVVKFLTLRVEAVIDTRRRHRDTRKS